MATLTVKGVPEPLVAELKRQAAAHRRSLNGELLHRLERSLNRPSDPEAWLERLRKVRGEADFATTLERIVEARDSGRK